MRIDERIEDHVRNAFSAVIARDGRKMVDALRGLDETDSRIALGLALYVCGFVVNDVYRDGATEHEVRELAEQITRSEANWVTLDPDEVTTLLTAAATGDGTFGGLARKDVPALAFISGGHLVGAFSHDDQPWYEYLDEIWAAFEAQPQPAE